jgi:DNA invertase Pin-like site-specific DNA recombinase
MSKFLMHLFAAFAEMERGMIRERVQAGVRAAKARGTRLRHPQRVFRRVLPISHGAPAPSFATANPATP